MQEGLPFKKNKPAPTTILLAFVWHGISQTEHASKLNSHPGEPVNMQIAWPYPQSF